jgi:hypothetical protein
VAAQQLGNCENCGREVLVLTEPAPQGWAGGQLDRERHVVEAAPILANESAQQLVYAPPGSGTAGRSIGLGSIYVRHRCSDPAQSKARATDPATSKRAARESEPRRSSQRGRILRYLLDRQDLLVRSPHADQIADALDLPLSSVSTRMSELLRGGWVVEHTPTQGPLGQPKMTYRASAKAREWAQRNR